MMIALGATMSCQEVLKDLDPREADFVALCDVREEKDGYALIIKEVWKGRELLPSDLQSHPEGTKLMVQPKETMEPSAPVSKSALVCLKRAPDNDNNILESTHKQSVFFVEEGRIDVFRDGVHDEPISIRTLRSQIKE